MIILQRGASINENIEVATSQSDEQPLGPNINTFKEQHKENLLRLSDYKPDTLQRPNKAFPYLPQRCGLALPKWT